MALSGLKIQKLLSKTNCKECGSNTCLAFAMKLAAKKAELSECPYASDEAKEILGAASEPPVRSLALGADESVKLGAETCLYRHEKTFVNQTAIAININDTDSAEHIDMTLTQVKDYVLERVGEELLIDMVAVTQKGQDAAAFASLAKKAYEVTGKPLVLRSDDAQSLAAAASAVKGSRSVLASATADSAEMLVNAATEGGHVLAVSGANLDELVSLTAKIKDGGFNDLVLDFRTFSLAERMQTNSIARRAALRNSYKPLGYPSLCFVEEADPLQAVADITTEITKYGGICVLPAFNAALISGITGIQPYNT